MRLMTWNIQWARGADGGVDLDRVVAHAQKFADFDLLCLVAKQHAPVRKASVAWLRD